MIATHIWRGCLIKELNIPDSWKSSIMNTPGRHDIFWVIVASKELEYLFSFMKDEKHKGMITQAIKKSPQSEYPFIISRSGEYIQSYPYLILRSPGSLWQSIGEIEFREIRQLDYIQHK